MNKQYENEIKGKELSISISCPVETKVLQIIRTFVTSIAKEVGFDEEDSAKIEIAVDEACANVVCHAYGTYKENQANYPPKEKAGSINFEIKMNVTISQDSLKIDIQDFGVGVKNGIMTGVQEIEEYITRDKKHGLGTYIIQKFMDKVEFDFYAKKGTKVSMTKYLPPPRV